MVIGDNVGLSHIYTKNPYNYHHSPVIRPIVNRLAGRSLIWVEGEKEHKRMRSLIAPAFSPDNVRAMHVDVYYVSSALQARILNEINASGESSLQLNILDYTARATLDVIGRVAFGHDFNAVGDAPDAIKIVNTVRAHNEMACEHSTFTGLLILRLFPWITSLPLKAIQAQSAVAGTVRSSPRIWSPTARLTARVTARTSCPLCSRPMLVDTKVSAVTSRKFMSTL